MQDHPQFDLRMAAKHYSRQLNSRLTISEQLSNPSLREHPGSDGGSLSELSSGSIGAGVGLGKSGSPTPYGVGLSGADASERLRAWKAAR
eukprot:SAG31_NODE_2059_length_6539_cov_4.699845_3_plen_90_part_00